MKVAVIGAGGMVGRALLEHCQSAGDEVAAFDRQALDITDERAVTAALAAARPEAVFNCAAWTEVDACELDPQRAYEVNARGVRVLASESRLAGAGFVTISTDYVFDGSKDGFYTQRDDPQPASAYGRAKLQGERHARDAYARSIVVRTGWIYGVGGKNFLASVIARARRGEHLKAIADAYGTPTYVKDLAARLRELLVLDLPGIYHVAGGGDGASYAEFALAALESAGETASRVETISMDTLRRPAPRPRNSRLRCLLSEAIGLAPMRHWRDALGDFAAAHDEAATGTRA